MLKLLLQGLDSLLHHQGLSQVTPWGLGEHCASDERCIRTWDLPHLLGGLEVRPDRLWETLDLERLSLLAQALGVQASLNLDWGYQG